MERNDMVYISLIIFKQLVIQAKFSIVNFHFIALSGIHTFSLFCIHNFSCFDSLLGEKKSGRLKISAIKISLKDYLMLTWSLLRYLYVDKPKYPKFI